MKLLIALIFVIIVECQGARIAELNHRTNSSLRQAFNNINVITAEIFDQKPVDKMFQDSLNHTCINKLLKLDKIGEKILNENLTKWILAMAAIHCMSNDQKSEFLTLIITNGFKVYEHEGGDHRCSKVLLQKVDPMSRMIENFEEDVEDVEVELCEQFLIADALDEIIKRYVGDFKDHECVGLIRERQKKFMVVFLNLAVEEDQDVLESEMEKYVEIFKGYISEVFRCFMIKLV